MYFVEEAVLEKIYAYFEENKIATTLILILIVVIGIFISSGLKQEVMPPTDMDTLMVTVRSPGASAKDVEVNITIPIEEAIQSVMGVSETVSLSMENMAKIYIYLNQDSKNIQNVKNELMRNIQAVSLPNETEDVIFKDINPKFMKVLTIGLHQKKGKKISQKQIFAWSDKIEKGLRRVSGVADVSKEGYLDPEIKIDVNPDKMKYYYVSLDDVANSIRRRNIRSTGGTLQSVKGEKNIVTIGQFENPMDVGNVIVRSSFEKKRVLVKDLASVKSSFTDPSVLVKINREPGLTISVTKKENADISRTVRNVREYLKKISAQLPDGLSLTILDDRSLSVKALLNVVKSNAFVGFILVFIVLLLFLDFRSAFWTAMGIPVSVLLIVTYLYFAGISLNTISLGAIITVLGMLVDHGIVISENIFEKKKLGLSASQAVYLGVREVIGPISVTILTTIVAFIPLLVVGGKMGKFIAVYPIIVTVALLASFFDSVFLLPNHLSHGKVKPQKKSDWFGTFAEMYRKLLEKVLKVRYAVLVVFIAIFVGTVVLSKRSFKKFVLFPSSSADTFYINAETPQGTSLKQTYEKLKQLEKIVLKTIASNDLIAMKTIAGHHREKSWNDQGLHENWGQIIVYLIPTTQRQKSASDYISQIQKKLKKKPLADFDKIIFGKLIFGPDAGKGVDIKFVGTDEASLKDAVNLLTSFLKKQSGVRGIDTDLKPGKKELKIDFDYDKLAQLNMDVQTVARVIRMAYQGDVVTSIQTPRNRLDFRVRIDPHYQKSLKFLKELLIPNRQGRLIPLKKIAKIREGQSESILFHYNGDRSVTVTANLNKKQTTSKIIMKKAMTFLKQHKKDLNGIQVIGSGEAKETKNSLSGLISAFFIAIFAIYFVLVLLFKNPFHPLLVLIVIPFGMTGALAAFMLHGLPLSFMGLVGLIGLSGVVVNDAVVMVSFINERMKSGEDSMLSKISQGAKKRLRAVVLTTLTTVGGLLPTVYGLGGSSESIVPVAMALAYGLLFATLLTLFFIPALYFIGMDLKDLPKLFKKAVTVKK